ncbi:MAG: hypothetical protein DSY91_07340 [Deltaproteobacteria bacterium]|nr:MAG: hypothetical protein DSY91_07340 [Deltaproteobacteria bacterium]
MKNLEPGTGETLDVLGEDRLHFIQPKNGYRFSIDSLLLWGFLRPQPGDRWIDLGTGCGILAIALARISGVKEVVGLDVQPELVTLAKRNALLNHVEKRLTFLVTDLRDTEQIRSIGQADGVCANPPYYRALSGRLNPDPQKAVARHEIKGRMEEFIHAGGLLLKKGGTFVTILPPLRLQDALLALSASGLNLSRMRPVHSRGDQPATLVLLEAIKGETSPLSLEPPLVIYQSPGLYSQEVQDLMSLNPLHRY